jgi:3'-phosphoadenosine 5'-phosphosulfate sulfotransferase (PAPS reductase)/FAD synthetase
MKHTREELAELQALPLEEKVLRTQTRIIEWYLKHKGKVYVSFSGGKDSTVLLHIVRQIYPDVPAVYCDTGLEFPEVKEHVKRFENVVILRPKMSFREVLKKYGWCYPGKKIAHAIEYAQKGSQWAINQMDGKFKNGEKSTNMQRFKKWKFLVDSPYKISNRCCDVMKKQPLHTYEKETQQKPIVGIMADESKTREDAWLQTGCNSFDGKKPRSAPLSFWTQQDIFSYIVKNDLPIPSVYGDIVKGNDGIYRTTGEQRTGCMFCPVGFHLEKDNRWIRMRHTHPKIYEYCMEQLGLREFLEYIGKHLHKDFFEEQLTLF